MEAAASLSHSGIANVILLLVAVSAILMLSGRENYARQMQQMEAYIQGLSGRTAQHASDVFCG